jgi:hypothetical protein
MPRANTSRLTVSNRAMLALAVLVFPAEFVIMTVYVKTLDTSGGGIINKSIDEGVHALAVLGAIGVVVSALLAGLSHEPRRKVSGAVACLIVLAISLVQAIYFVTGWLKYG